MSNLEKEKNEFEKQLDELKEFQENRYNPGYSIGSGRVRTPISILSRYPWLLLILGLFILAKILYDMYELFNTEMDYDRLSTTIPSEIISLIISGALIYGGVVRIVANRKKNKN